MVKSAAVLGIREDHIKVVDDRELPDDPAVEWHRDIVGKYIIESVTKLETKAVSYFHVFCFFNVFNSIQVIIVTCEYTASPAGAYQTLTI